MNSNVNDPSAEAIYPLALEKTSDRDLMIRWQDGVQQRIPYRLLRDSCRCAHCTEKHKMTAPSAPKPSTSLPVLSPAETMPVDIVSMHPAGNYGYKIAFSDGHSSGIYTFEMLRSITLSTRE